MCVCSQRVVYGGGIYIITMLSRRPWSSCSAGEINLVATAEADLRKTEHGIALHNLFRERNRSIIYIAARIILLYYHHYHYDVARFAS